MSREATIGQLKTGEWVLSLCDNYAIWAFALDTGKCIAERSLDPVFYEEGYPEYDIDENGNYDASKPIAFVPYCEEYDDFGGERMEGSIWFSAPHPSLPADVIETANKLRMSIPYGYWFAREWVPSANFHFKFGTGDGVYKAVVEFKTGEFGVCVSDKSGTPSNTHYYTADGQLISNPPLPSSCTIVECLPADVREKVCQQHPEFIREEPATIVKG